MVRNDDKDARSRARSLLEAAVARLEMECAEAEHEASGCDFLIALDELEQCCRVLADLATRYRCSDEFHRTLRAAAALLSITDPTSH